MDKVSVIVPVYNAEQFIDRCIQSLFDQTWKNIEIVLINDGSTDTSSDKCLNFSDQDSRIVYIDSENKGVTAARNLGLERCTGEYITFLDADDWLDSNFIENAVVQFNKYPQIDICIFGMQNDYGDGSVVQIGQVGIDSILDQRDAINEIFGWNYFRWEMCGKVYRRELFDGYRADESITIAEDLDSNWYLFHKAKYSFYSGKVKYHYFVNENSATLSGKYAYDTTIEVYDRILNSNYYLPYQVRMRIFRDLLKFIPKKIRDMYYEDPKRFRNDIRDLGKRFMEFADLFKDDPILKCGLLRVLTDYNGEEQSDIFVEEFNIIRNAANSAVGFSRIYIYGIGVCAEYLFRSFSGTDQKKITFLVSDDRSQINRRKYCGGNVFHISDIQPDDDSVIIMSVRDELRADIVNNLKEKGYKNIIEFSMRNIYTRL